MKHNSSACGILSYVCILVAMVACYLGVTVASPLLVVSTAAMTLFAMSTEFGILTRTSMT